MDPLTHSLVGGAIARTRVARGTRLATVALVLAANAPDVDVASAFFGRDASLGFRRGLTHGPLGVLVLPAVLTILLLAWARWRERRRPDLPRVRSGRLLALSYLGCLTHPLLDWLNTYGVRLLMPFDDRWFYGDALFIVDPWLWLVLGGALCLGSPRGWATWAWASLAVLTSLVVLRSSAPVPAAARVAWIAALVVVATIRALRVTVRPAAIAHVALAAAVVYIGAMIGASRAGASRVAGQLERDGVPAERLMVAPAPANPLAWDIVADVGDRYLHGSLTWSPRPTLRLASQPILKPAPSPVLDAARADPEVQGTLRWMRFPYAEIDETARGSTVYFLDARYVRGRARGFGSAVVEVPRPAP